MGILVLFSLRQKTSKSYLSCTLPKKAVKCLYSESRLPCLRGLWQCLCVLGLNVGFPDIWKLTSTQTFLRKVDGSHRCGEGRCCKVRVQEQFGLEDGSSRGGWWISGTLGEGLGVRGNAWKERPMLAFLEHARMC